MAVEVPRTLEYMGDQLNVAPLLEWKISQIGKRGSCDTSLDFQDSPDDEEDIRSSQEYLNDLKEEYQARALLAKSKRFFKKESKKSSGAKATEETQCHKCGRKGHFERDCFSKTPVPSFSSPFLNNTQPNSINPSKHKLKLKADKDFKSKYNKVKARLALLSPVSSDKDELVDVKSLMALGDEERVPMSKEDVRNGEWVQNSMKKVHTLLELEDNDDRKAVLNHLCSDLRYVKEQRNNLLSKHKDLVETLKSCKEKPMALE
ncbi:retrovirus-related pol polyprotein from transposon TNT 1-94 [Tanacetum coccineum]